MKKEKLNVLEMFEAKFITPTVEVMAVPGGVIYTKYYNTASGVGSVSTVFVKTPWWHSIATIAPSWASILPAWLPRLAAMPEALPGVRKKLDT